MLMQNFGVTNKEYYGMLWYFLEWSIQSVPVSFGLWDTALKFLSPGPRSDVTDHLAGKEELNFEDLQESCNQLLK